MFDSILGHARPVRVLTLAVERHRIAQAYLFYGEEGIGKRTVARMFARRLLCVSKSEDLGAECDSCRKFERGSHPDFQEIRPEGAAIKIGQIREIQEGLALPPLGGKRKVYLFEAADRLNPEAANALLKTLEEPPPYVVLILVAHRLHVLPDTLLSRCQKLPFLSPSPEELERWLVERQGCEPREARMRVEAAWGKPGEVLSLDAAEALARAERLARLVSREQLSRPSALLALAEEFGRDPENFQAALRHLSRWLRDLRVEKIRAKPAVPTPAAALSEEGIDRLFEWTQRIHAVLHRNINRPLALEVLLLELREQFVREKAAG